MTADARPTRSGPAPTRRALLRLGLVGGAPFFAMARPCHGAAAAPAVSAPAREALLAIAALRDHRQQPFAVLDKLAARLWVFDPALRLVGSAPVLLGAARGDGSVPGIGQRAMSAIRPHERTTPAGRFRLEPGRNLNGEDIFWVDYGAAVSLHRLRPVHAAERRAQRLASPSAADNRISYGCINVPSMFYDRVIRPLFGHGRGHLYVLPETRPVHTLFPGLHAPGGCSARCRP